MKVKMIISADEDVMMTHEFEFPDGLLQRDEKNMNIILLDQQLMENSGDAMIKLRDKLFDK